MYSYIHVCMHVCVCMTIFTCICTQIWYIDGTVECFAGTHIPLAIVAMLVLVFCGLLVVFLTAVVKKNSKVYVVTVAS